jgi:hypothetical protein
MIWSATNRSGEIIKEQGLTKYIGLRQEKGRNQKRHSNFYIGLHANAWVESWQMFAIETQQLMNLIPPKCANYTKSCFEKLITIGHKLANDS